MLLRSILTPAAAVCCLLAAVPAHADRPFQDADLFSGHSLRQSSKDRKIAAGVNMHVAPVRFVARKALDAATDKVAGKYPGAKDLVAVLKQTNDAAKINELATAGKVQEVKDQINADLKANNVSPTAEQQKAIDSIAPDNVAAVADLASVVATPNDGIAFGIEPWFEYNFGTYDLTAYVPLAAFSSPKDGMSLEMGNVNLDFRAGSRLGYTAAIGWTGGLSLYLPTGTEKANQIALSNVLVLPKYLHEYMSIQPYGIFGVQLAILTLMARAEFTHMQAVRDNPLNTSVGYGNWGASAVLRAVFIDFVAELDGLVNLYNAPGMTDILATAGARGHLGPVRLGVAARMPITSNPNSLYAQSFGTLGNIAKVNILVQGFMTF